MPRSASAAARAAAAAADRAERARAAAERERKAVAAAKIRVSGVDAARLAEARRAARALWAKPMPPASLGSTADRSTAPRLGWVDLPFEAEDWRLEGSSLRTELHDDGLRRLVVVGMGGSGLGAATLVSLLPPRFTGSWDPPLSVRVLDTLAPEAVRAAIAPRRVRETAYLIASKSGETVETRALEAVIARAVEREAGSVSQLLALSDPGSPLLERARRGGWRAAYEGRPDVGGRFSALGPYGLLPAALAARDIEGPVFAALRHRKTLNREFEGPEPPEDPGVGLGALLAVLHDAGWRQIHLTAAPDREALLPWLEQLFAESAGKEGKGLLPVVLPPHPRPAPRAPAGESGVRPVLLHLGPADEADALRLDEAAAAGTPVIRCPTPRDQALGEVFRWQVAVAVFAWRIGVDPFGQPDIDGSKALARRLLAEESGPPGPPPPPAEDLGGFLRGAARGGLAINCFGHRGRAAVRALGGLQRRLAEALGAVPAVAFGPGLLHTLGQLEKGGPPDLSVLMLTWRGGGSDVRLPPSRRGVRRRCCGEISRLLAAADYRALREAGRRVLWLDSGKEGLAPLLRRVEDAAPGPGGGDGG